MAPSIRVSLSVGLCGLLLAGCKHGSSEASRRAPAASASADLGSAHAAEAGIRWKAPDSWTTLKPDNPMRRAVYRIAPVGGDNEPAELVVYYFGPRQGGSVDANVERWMSQFADADRSTIKRADRIAHGLTEHTVEIPSGTYQSGMPGGKTTPKRGWGLLGAIVTAPTGEYFFKLTGPTHTVQAARNGFYQLLDSVEPTG